MKFNSIFKNISGKQFSPFEALVAITVFVIVVPVFYLNIQTYRQRAQHEELTKIFSLIKTSIFSVGSSIKPDRIYIQKEIKGPRHLPEPLGEVYLPAGVTLHYLYNFFKKGDKNSSQRTEFAVSSDKGDELYRYLSIDGHGLSQRILKDGSSK